jgi:hypothetical protein
MGHNPRQNTCNKKVDMRLQTRLDAQLDHEKNDKVKMKKDKKAGRISYMERGRSSVVNQPDKQPVVA